MPKTLILKNTYWWALKYNLSMLVGVSKYKIVSIYILLAQTNMILPHIYTSVLVSTATSINNNVCQIGFNGGVNCDHKWKK